MCLVGVGVGRLVRCSNQGELANNCSHNNVELRSLAWKTGPARRARGQVNGVLSVAHQPTNRKNRPTASQHTAAPPTDRPRQLSLSRVGAVGHVTIGANVSTSATSSADRSHSAAATFART